MAIKKIKPEPQGRSAKPELKLAAGGPDLPEVYKKIVLALEKTSTHPMAKALRAAYQVQGRLPPVGDYTNSDGVGVSGYIYGKYYCLTKDPEAREPGLSCVLQEDDRPLFLFKFEYV
jgi:cation transport ATPase